MTFRGVGKIASYVELKGVFTHEFQGLGMYISIIAYFQLFNNYPSFFAMIKKSFGYNEVHY